MKSLDDIIDEHQREDITECPSGCNGCTCFLNPPCGHCTEGHGMEREKNTSAVLIDSNGEVIGHIVNIGVTS